ncbi:tetraacyldisaccharide 4'-kinase [Candidatus Aminicenantes bacterium AC-334-E05]|nr:tetraacyldisaccharide 4'-kinase [Candidatus Aminicenantes bacterium AC-334-E05]
MGYRVAILLRGYKGKFEKRGAMVSDGKNILYNWKEASDEAFLIAKNVRKAGVFVGKNRVINALNAMELGFNLIILDDGFQYRPLYRNIDIVIISSENRKLLREPFSSLKRANILLFYNTIDEKISKKIRKFNLYISKFHYLKLGFYDVNENNFYLVDYFKGKKAIAFCGIANPSRFKRFLEELEVDIKHFSSFPDHYSYPQNSINTLLKKHRELKTDVLLTTEKDALKLKAYSNLPIYYLKIKACLSDDLISYILKGLKTYASD